MIFTQLKWPQSKQKADLPGGTTKIPQPMTLVLLKLQKFWNNPTAAATA